MMVSRLAPAEVTTSMTSSWHHWVVTSLIRTQRVLRPQSRVLRAAQMLARAVTLTEAATESSRSRNTWSAAEVAAFCSIFSLLPGTESCERRARLGRGVTIVDASCLGGDRRPFRQEVLDLGFGKPGLAQARDRILAEQGRAAAHPAGGGGHLDGDAGDPDCLTTRLLDLHD